MRKLTPILLIVFLLCVAETTNAISFTYYLSENGTLTAHTASSEVTLPTTIAPVCSDNWTFVGWTDRYFVETTTLPPLVTSVNEANYLYAVYTRNSHYALIPNCVPDICQDQLSQVKLHVARNSASFSFETVCSSVHLTITISETSTVVFDQDITSPFEVTGLAEHTTFDYELTPAEHSCSQTGFFTTPGALINITEWQNDGIVVYVDKDEGLTPKIQLQTEMHHNNASAVASELFISKYFEAIGSVKLLAIYNGTTSERDLTQYRLRIGLPNDDGTPGIWTNIIDLVNCGSTRGKIQSGEELLLYYADDSNPLDQQVVACATAAGFDFSKAHKDSRVSWTGRETIVLERVSESGSWEAIDLFGETNYAGHPTAGDCRPDWGDMGVGHELEAGYYGWCETSMNIDNEDNIYYRLSSNRCLLVRRNTVTSGDAAVQYNIDNFNTLSSEWKGQRVENSTDDGVTSSCNGFQKVLEYAYDDYYRDYDDVVIDQYLEPLVYSTDEELYKLPFTNIKDYACENVRIVVTDEFDDPVASYLQQVPIIVEGNVSTTNTQFSGIANTFTNSEKICKTCDVVVLKNANLTIPKLGSKKITDLYNLSVYPGGKLTLPEGATATLNNLNLRRVDDDSPAADLQGTITFKGMANPVHADIRINAERWYWMALPYTCNIADVTFEDGTPALYNQDWFLMYYDGERRAAERNNGTSWKLFTGSTIKAGEGYIVGIVGKPANEKVKYTLRFPMAEAAVPAELLDKSLPVYAYGAGKTDAELPPNNKGWNLVGAPYMMPYDGQSIETDLRNYILDYDSLTGIWSTDSTGTEIPYVTIPVDGGWWEYKQVALRNYSLQPFMSYFVQVHGNTDGELHTMNFAADQKNDYGDKPLLKTRSSASTWMALDLTSPSALSDQTTLVINDEYTDAYEVGADLLKWLGDHYAEGTKPVLYSINTAEGVGINPSAAEKLAFHALPEASAAVPVPVGYYAGESGQYTFSLNQPNSSQLRDFVAIWLHDKKEDVYTNLLKANYNFFTENEQNDTRFTVAVQVNHTSDDVSALSNFAAGDPIFTAVNHSLVVDNLPPDAQFWIYNASGQLLGQNTIPGDVLSGTYFLRVSNAEGTVTLSTIVK